jgi:glycosyltransferase involved in cell wall biosynthesis
MKITFVLPTVDFGGGMRVAAMYARLLTRMGHSVVAVSTPPPVSSKQRILRSLGLRGPTAPRGSHFDDLKEVHRVGHGRPIREADLPDADVVIATWWETAEWVAQYSARKGTKVYFVQHHEVFDWLPIARSAATYRLPLHKIVVAQWLRRVMETLYGDVNVDLVPNSVDHAQFFAPDRGKQASPTVGFLYSKARFKGVETALAAIDRLRRSVPSLRVLSFGEHMPAPGEIGVAEFHLSPAQFEIRDLYASCDVWMTASRSEGFNLPAMEAMACRTPVVSTRTGWPEEAIVNGRNGWCVDVDDVEGLARGAESVLNLSDADWRATSARAFDTVRHSSWDASAKLFESALIRLKEAEPECACATTN